MATDDSPFLSRWSQRKLRVREGLPHEPAPPAPVGAATPPTAPASPAEAAVAAPHPASPPTASAPAPSPELTLEDVTALTRESDYSGFVARGVGPDVRNAALKKLFTDPHFNVMDGLDTYIEDYGLADPLPEGMLRKMVQSQFLGLFADESPASTEPSTETLLQTPAPAAPAAEPTALPSPNPADEDADLQLQPDDALGRPGPEPGPGEDDGRQH